MKKTAVQLVCTATMTVGVTWMAGMAHGLSPNQMRISSPETLAVPSKDPAGARNAAKGSATDIAFYSGRRGFETANPGLSEEDFEDFTDAFVVCDAPADNTSSCPGGWPVGAILPGLVIDTQLYSGPGNFGLAIIPTGYDCNNSIELASAFFVDATVVELLPAVDAVGFDVACHDGASQLEVEVYDGDGQLVWSDVAAPCEAAGSFLGWSTTAAAGIGRIELFESSGSSREALDDIAFGDLSATVYGTRSEFDDANPNLPVEGFQDFVDVLRVCDAPAETDTQCTGAYGPSDILPGLAIDCTENSGPGNQGLVVLSTGVFGNDSIEIASTYEPDDTIIVLSPAASAVGLDIACYPGTSLIQMDVLDSDGGLIWSGNLAPCAETGTFVGWSTSSRKGIGRIELFSSTDTRERVDDIAIDTPLLFRSGFETGTLDGWSASFP